MNLPIPIYVLYAGLLGTLLALFVATYQNKWQWKVFFLLALRLAIGWHFLFEGMHKIHSHVVGPTETNRPFSSEPYFKASQTEVGAMMRKEFDDPQAVIASKVRVASAPAGFAKRSDADQAADCPKAVADELDAVPSGDATSKSAAKAAYARWVFGVDGRASKVKFVTGDVSLTAPQRLSHLEWLRAEVKAAEDRRNLGIGNGNGVEMKRAAELRTELSTAEADLAKDANAFVGELKIQANGGKPVEEQKVVKAGERLDRITMYFIAAVGACLLAGFFTRPSCVLAAGFLAVTYLTFPAYPWLPQPPNTEGNPLFVNKNVIEALALLALACFPTGRWLGLDAIFYRLVFRKDDPVVTV